jgi:hypothetical protein
VSANHAMRCSCVDIPMGSYARSVEVVGPDGALVHCDACMVPELSDLWRRGIRTIASCCGHNRVLGFVAVRAEHDAQMVALGYYRCSDQPHCFVAKTQPGAALIGGAA